MDGHNLTRRSFVGGSALLAALMAMPHAALASSGLDGIDISGAQGYIDVPSVPADFVIVKATEGTTYTSAYLSAQAGGALDSGKLLGLYHYARGNTVAHEVSNFLAAAEPYIGQAALFLDWEGYGNSLFGSGDEDEWIAEFCAEVKARTGVMPLVYASSSVAFSLGVDDAQLWVAQYANSVATGYQSSPWNEGSYSCAIRQYSSTGRLDGYSGNLDLDRFYGSRADWLALARNTRGAAVQLYDGNATDAQRWAVAHNDDGSVTLTATSCGLALDVAGAGTADGTAVQVHTPNGSAAQRWLVRTVGGGYSPESARPIELEPECAPGLRLDCIGAGLGDGTGIQTYEANGTNAQRWVVLDHGDGTWTLVNVGSSKALDVVGGGV